MSYIPDRKIMELTKQINDARELFEQVTAERDKLKDDLAAARALLREAYDHPHKLDSDHSTLRSRIYRALAGKDAPRSPTAP